jgi:hypothetical protein
MGFNPQWRNLSTAQNMQPDPSFVEPVAVLQTAATATGNNTALSYKWQENRPADSFMVLLHFADFQSAQLREFDIYFNGNRLGPCDKPYRPQYLASSTVCSSGWYRASDGNYNITLVASAVSELPPMLNAIEIYTLLAFDTPTTFPDDCEFFTSSLTPHSLSVFGIGLTICLSVSCFFYVMETTNLSLILCLWCVLTFSWKRIAS